LAEELIDTLIDLLFFADFTLPRPQNTKNKVTYAIWQSGVGCNTSVGTTKEFESNRTEILRLLLTLTSQSMYMSANLLPVQGVKAISYIVTCPDKQVVLSTLCSLLNTVRAKITYRNGPLTCTGPQVQPCELESTVQCTSIQGSEANFGHLCITSENRGNFLGGGH
jgi:High-temperature-induced dauer-formation protein